MKRSASAPPAPRIEILDELRGLCIVCMVFFHAFFDMAFIFGIFPALYDFFLPAEPVFAGIFVAICGICCRLSRSNLRRGLIIAAAAAGVSLVTYFLSQRGVVDPIYFGILHMLAVSVLLFAAARPLLDKVPPPAGVAVCALLAVLLWNMPHGSVGIAGLRLRVPSTLPDIISVPIGINPADSAFSDYFPLVPWIFIFTAGTFLGKYFAEGRIPKFFYRKHVPFLSAVGRHSLIIYILHQPVIYALLLAADALIKRL